MLLHFLVPCPDHLFLLCHSPATSALSTSSSIKCCICFRGKQSKTFCKIRFLSDLYQLASSSFFAPSLGFLFTPAELYVFVGVEYLLWSGTSPWYQENYTVDEVSAIMHLVVFGHYRFQPMRRYFLPKPNKPGKFRPITEPASWDRLLLEAINRVLNRELDSKFSEYSHGFRPSRGAKTFFRE